MPLDEKQTPSDWQILFDAANPALAGKPWLSIGDNLTDDTRAEAKFRQLALGPLDAGDELARAAFSLDLPALVAILRRKPLLGGHYPAAFNAILDTIEKAHKATRQTLRNRRTRAAYAELAADVWMALVVEEDLQRLSPRLAIGEAKHRVAKRRKLKTKAQHRKLDRACTNHGIGTKALSEARSRKPVLPKKV
jgi:hypothetical protein